MKPYIEVIDSDDDSQFMIFIDDISSISYDEEEAIPPLLIRLKNGATLTIYVSYEEVKSKIDIALGAPETDSKPVTVNLGYKDLVTIINRNGVAFDKKLDAMIKKESEWVCDHCSNTEDVEGEMIYQDGKRDGQKLISEALMDEAHWRRHIFNNKEWVTEILETIDKANNSFPKDEQAIFPRSHLTSEKFWLDYIANNSEEIHEVGAAICKARILYDNREVLAWTMLDNKETKKT